MTNTMLTLHLRRYENDNWACVWWVGDEKYGCYGESPKGVICDAAECVDALIKRHDDEPDYSDP